MTPRVAMPRQFRLSTPRANAWGLLVAAEAIASAAGFFVVIHLARSLGATEFASVEIAGAIAGVLLVWVRSGIESIAQREAARHPRLIGPLTDALILIKVALAILGLIVMAAIVPVVKTSSLPVLFASGLVLIPSALCPDLGPRALGSFRLLAACQLLRAGVLVAAAFLLVSSPADAIKAAACIAIAEGASTIAFAIVHERRFRRTRPRIRARAARILLARGLVASLGRFGRVFLYAIDLLILGVLLPAEELGPYAASRRIVFAIAGIALAIPTAIAPLLAADWLNSEAAARDRLSQTTSQILGLSLAASLGLALTSAGWIQAIFGSEYAIGRTALILIGWRLPLLLLAAMTGATLVAVRREADVVTIVFRTSAIAIVVLPMAILASGPIGAAWAMIAIEAIAATWGWRSLARIGAAQPFPTLDPADLLGIAAMAASVLACSGLAVWTTSLVGASAFFATRATWQALRSKHAMVEAAR